MMSLLVSVHMITYNQEKYIAEAIEGVLMQKINFNYELVISDDCSADGTLKIIKDYQELHPNIIRVINREKNLGSMANFIDTFSHCNGKYIAICEGDDYWIDPLKLQKQVDFLEKNNDYSLCFHNANVINENAKKVRNLRRHFGNKTFSSSEVIKRGSSFIPTASILFRKQIISKLPGWFHEAPVGDLFINILCAMSGKTYYIDNLMSVYRQNSGNWSTGMMQKENFGKRLDLHVKIIQILDEIKENSEPRYFNAVNHLRYFSMKVLLVDNYNQDFVIKYKTHFLNELSYRNKLEVLLMQYIPIIPTSYKKGINFIKMFF